LRNDYRHIINSLDALAGLVNQRLQCFFAKDGEILLPAIQPPGEAVTNGEIRPPYPRDTNEFMLLLIALAPQVRPALFEAIIQQYLPQGGDFPEFGGVKGGNYRGMLPTGVTAQFVLAGDDPGRRCHIQSLLQRDSFLVKENILSLEPVREGEPVMSGRLILSSEWLRRFFEGREVKPDYGPDFPARLITTAMDWEDLVLNHYTLGQIQDIKTWLEYNGQVLQDKVLQRKIKPGYRVLFYGPSGTGKTLTATLLGKQFGKDVYRIDLSQIVSKYIGETEKNLERVFSKAENKDWILFFDEADALFGKRTNVQNAHDRYANQEVSYLLQRVEEFPGLLILASNFKNNIDEAFARRLHAIVNFPAPSASERLSLWQKTMPASLRAEPAIHLPQLSEKYDLTGAAILNVVHFAALKSLARSDEHIRLNDLIEGVKREYKKDERTINL
jgi:hypothetical protein